MNTHTHTHTRARAKVNTEDTLAGFFLQPIIKDRSNTLGRLRRVPQKVLDVATRVFRTSLTPIVLQNWFVCSNCDSFPTSTCNCPFSSTQPTTVVSLQPTNESRTVLRIYTNLLLDSSVSSAHAPLDVQTCRNQRLITAQYASHHGRLEGKSHCGLRRHTPGICGADCDNIPPFNVDRIDLIQQPAASSTHTAGPGGLVELLCVNVRDMLTIRDA